MRQIAIVIYPGCTASAKTKAAARAKASRR
jgi:hypothetical protein